MKLSIIIPIYNEEKTIIEILNRIKKINIEKELIVVNDGSSDKSYEILNKMKDIKLINHQKNMGKGVAIRTGLKYVTGDIVIIQDADLEYNPEDYYKLVEPFVNNKVHVVYGSRFYKKNDLIRVINLVFNKKEKILKSFLYLGGNVVLTTITAILYWKKISDMETCYKVFKSDIIKNISLKEDRFGFEPEVTAKLMKKKYKIYEIPISYNPRGLDQGKKITIKDGIKAVWYLIKYRFVE